MAKMTVNRYLVLYLLCTFMVINSSHIYAHINIDRIAKSQLQHEPYEWTMIDELFNPIESAEIARTYPCDHFKTVKGYDSEKGYQYEVRQLIPMGEKKVAYTENLSPAWQQLAHDLLSDEYRMAMSELTGIDLSSAPIEVNIFHYGRGAWLGPHVDLKDKIVTHVLYFNSEWDPKEGGCLTILGSKNIDDAVFIIPPVIGNSSVLVRSNSSWHAVLPISEQCKTSRRSMTITFYRPHSISTMWPPGDFTPLHEYGIAIP
jgi:Rps23 Pro-64 3,4-dihydroxylase Tpa1-like proline 4-hydroxylase